MILLSAAGISIWYIKQKKSESAPKPTPKSINDKRKTSGFSLAKMAKEAEERRKKLDENIFVV